MITEEKTKKSAPQSSDRAMLVALCILIYRSTISRARTQAIHRMSVRGIAYY